MTNLEIMEKEDFILNGGVIPSKEYDIYKASMEAQGVMAVQQYEDSIENPLNIPPTTGV